MPKDAQGKSDPFSIRLAAPEQAFVEQEMRRLRRSRSAIVEAYTAEAIRMRRFPGIAFRGDEGDRRAWVLGTGLDVWELVAIVRDFGSEREVAAQYELTPGQIRIALAYAGEFGDEIEDEIALGRQSEEELHSRYPFIQTFDAATAVAGS